MSSITPDQAARLLQSAERGEWTAPAEVLELLGGIAEGDVEASPSSYMKRLRTVEREAFKVMVMLRTHGESIVPHIMDTDDNAGQRLREAFGTVTTNGADATIREQARRIDVLRGRLDEACSLIRDMRQADDGQVFKDARKFLERIGK